MQVVQINAITLHERGFVYGALQGSILGPLLQQSVLQIIGPLVNLSFKNLAFLIFIVCFHSKSDPSCTCATMKCYLSLFKTYFKLEVKSIIVLLDMPSHTVLMQAYRTNMKQFTILYQRPRLWNSLPYSIIRSNNIRIFKRLLKSYLINLHNAKKIVWNLLLIIR